MHVQCSYAVAISHVLNVIPNRSGVPSLLIIPTLSCMLSTYINGPPLRGEGAAWEQCAAMLASGLVTISFEYRD